MHPINISTTPHPVIARGLVSSKPQLDRLLQGPRVATEMSGDRLPLGAAAAATGDQGPTTITTAAALPRPQAEAEGTEQSRMPRSFTHKMILCPIVLAVVQLAGGD